MSEIFNANVLELCETSEIQHVLTLQWYLLEYIPEIPEERDNDLNLRKINFN